MNSNLIISVVIVIIVISAGLGLYYVFGKDKTDKLYDTYNYINASLNFLEDDNQIATGYSVIYDGVDYINGTSTSSDFVRLYIPNNNSAVVINRNINNQTYYFTSYNLASNITEFTRISIPLEKVGSLSISKRNTLIDNNITVILESTGLIKNLMICERWSTNIVKASIYLNNSLLESEDIPLRYVNKVDKCYKSNIVLFNNATELKIEYKKFGEITPKDSITLYFIIGDYDFQNTYTLKYDKNSLPLLIEDKVFEIK
jgi:hypothetical protein